MHESCHAREVFGLTGTGQTAGIPELVGPSIEFHWATPRVRGPSEIVLSFVILLPTIDDCQVFVSRDDILGSVGIFERMRVDCTREG